MNIKLNEFDTLRDQLRNNIGDLYNSNFFNNNVDGNEHDDDNDQIRNIRQSLNMSEDETSNDNIE